MKLFAPRKGGQMQRREDHGADHDANSSRPNGSGDQLEERETKERFFDKWYD